MNLVTNRVSRILGKVENTERFLRVALYQGIPKQGIKTQRTLATTESTRTVTRQPTLLCTAYNKQRLFLFTTQEPDDSDQASTSRSDVTLKPGLLWNIAVDDGKILVSYRQHSTALSQHYRLSGLKHTTISGIQVAQFQVLNTPPCRGLAAWLAVHYA